MNSTDESPRPEKRKHSTFIKNAMRYGRVYAGYSGLQGVRYLGERRRNIWEKLWWITVLTMSLCACVYIISQTYSKLINSAIIISLAQKQTFVWHIPFPAVTICPANRCRKNIYNIAENYQKVSNESIDVPYDQVKQLYDIALVCTGIQNISRKLDNYTVDLGTYKFIEKVAPQLNDIMILCEGLNERDSCHHLFTTVITDKGVCFTFNMLDKKDIYKNEVEISDTLMVSRTWTGWTLDDGYLKNETRFTYPIRAVPGEAGALSIYLFDDKARHDRLCIGESEGFKIYIHNPGEVPIITAGYVHSPLNVEMVIVVKPDMIVTSEELKEYNADDRNCYYTSERELKYYKHYTQKNCELECLTNFTLNLCGCVSYFMPHNTSTRVCTYDQVNCSTEAKRLLLEYQINADISNDQDVEFGKCNCMPGCTQIGYNTESSETTFDLNEYFAHFDTKISDTKTLARITVILKEQQFVATERRENYNWAGFMSDCGGCLGLFMGFTFLWIFEAVYFFSLRIYCNIRRYGKHHWSGPEFIDEVEENKPEMPSRNDNIQQSDDSDEDSAYCIKLRKKIFH